MTNSEEWSLMQKKWNQELFGNRKGYTIMAKRKRVIVGNHEVTLTLDEDSVDALTWAIAKAKIDTVHKYRSEQDLAILRTVVKNMYRMGLLNDKPFKG